MRFASTQSEYDDDHVIPCMIARGPSPRSLVFTFDFDWRRDTNQLLLPFEEAEQALKASE